MKSKWKVASQMIGEVKHYAVYRIMDTTQVDHSGNREFSGGWRPDKEKADSIAEMLNGEGERHE